MLLEPNAFVANVSVACPAHETSVELNMTGEGLGSVLGVRVRVRVRVGI